MLTGFLQFWGRVWAIYSVLALLYLPCWIWSHIMKLLSVTAPCHCWWKCFQGFFFVYTGMPESLLYCSLHDPVSPCPAGYVTNKVCSQKVLQGWSFVSGSQPIGSLRCQVSTAWDADPFQIPLCLLFVCMTIVGWCGL